MKTRFHFTFTSELSPPLCICNSNHCFRTFFTCLNNNHNLFSLFFNHHLPTHVFFFKDLIWVFFFLNVRDADILNNWKKVRFLTKMNTVGPGGMDIPIMHESDRYELVRDIGSGNFGVARLMTDKHTNQRVAVKYIERGDKVCLFPFCFSCFRLCVF